MSLREFVSSEPDACGDQNPVGMLADRMLGRKPVSDTMRQVRDHPGQPGDQYIGLGGLNAAPESIDSMLRRPEQRNHQVDHLVEEFGQFDLHQRMQGHQQHSQWVNEFQVAHPSQRSWHDDFSEKQHWANEFSQSHQWADEFESKENPPAQINGAALDQLLQSSNPKMRNSKFVKFLTDLQSGGIELDAQNNSLKRGSGFSANAWAEQYEQMHLGPQKSWADEFEQKRAENWVDEFKTPFEQMGTLGDDMVENWVKEFEDIDWSEYARNFDEPTVLSEYEFALSNPYLNMSSEEAMLEGQRLIREGALSDAVLAFESRCQQNPEDALAWQLLGQAHQENEEDIRAVPALEKSIQLNPSSLETLLMLGVSHTNDLEQSRALDRLQGWLLQHPEFKDIAQNVTSSPLFTDLVHLFQLAAQKTPQDAQVHSALGVLYNLSGQYPLAEEAFHTAIQCQPEEASLWNKLGATMANGNRSTEAIEAYRKALQLKPSYVRALANLGISFANQGRHDRACAAYLAALQRNGAAQHIWGYLKISLSSLNRPELVRLAEIGDVEVFREHFQF